MNKRMLVVSILAVASSSVVASSVNRLPAREGATASVQTSIPATPTAGNILLDPGFEANTDAGTNPNWTSTSTAFGSSLCTVTACGTGGGAGAPRAGNGWVWFDGTGNGATAESGTATQTVIIPNGGPRFLNFYFRAGAVTAPSTSTILVQVDGVTLQTVTEPAVADAGYSRISVDVAAYANGASHTIGFVYSRPAGTTGSDNFLIDDVSLEIDTPVSLQNFSVD